MKLSMWIVYEWLKEYRPEAHIQEGQQTISGVRYMADDLELSKEYLYIGYSDAYIDQRDIHQLPQPGALTVLQRSEDAECGILSCHNITNGRTTADRTASGEPRDTHDACHRLRHRVKASSLTVGTVLPKAGDGAIDETRVSLPEHLISKAELFHYAWAEVFNQYIYAVYKFEKLFFAFLQI